MDLASYYILLISIFGLIVLHNRQTPCQRTGHDYKKYAHLVSKEGSIYAFMQCTKCDSLKKITLEPPSPVEAVDPDELVAALESTWNALDMVINPDKEINKDFNTDTIAKDTLKMTTELLNRVHGYDKGGSDD